MTVCPVSRYPMPAGPSPFAGGTLEPQRLRAMLDMLGCRRNPPVVLCIGTDRIIGDCLGPLVGTLLARKSSGALPVYGTLQQTVHARNLSETVCTIKKKHPDCIIVAVDASLGSRDLVGHVFVRSGGLQPGSGVAKQLPTIGDIAITGVTGAGSSHPYLDLQTARLSTVSAMADTICSCICETCLT